ncbi:MAG: High-affinity branched-chain amino acid transport system permease protein LivH [Paracidovorax wautersii]|uniref:High-affinity branched-chain amino acid transport system permease protein LivH n=1 Tax=Paracidovorax wautersii TaxID=1177982 RepID=A0A7V8FQ66_9BURK|nr:MAG: High-affinity branched-chain amino acid transport system permease protein LivH [Paracidovorax wautersii]
MDGAIAAILIQDGITSGAIYALLALAIVVVFTVTRVLFIPLGEFVAYGALTLAMLQLGHWPLSVNLLLGLAALAWLMELVSIVRQPDRRQRWAGELAAASVRTGAWPLLVACLFWALPQIGWPPEDLPQTVQMALALAGVVPMGPLLYRVAYQPLAASSALVLLIVSVGVHFALMGLGLWMFGAEGARADGLVEGAIDVGGLSVSWQSVVVIGATVAIMLALYLFFGRTITGKALHATAVNRRGAQIVGISTTQAGRLAFLLAAAIGALCGMLIAPFTTLYYDTGFLIGLKAFVGAIVGGLASFPLAVVGALMVGLIESFASFWASAFKEVLVFTLIIPVLLWRSIASAKGASHDEEVDS